MNIGGTRLIDAEEVASELGCSKSHAYKIIRTLNRELQKEGHMTLAGKVSRVYFERRFYCPQPKPVETDARL